MMQVFRAAARSNVCARAAMCVARPAAVAPLRTFTAPAFRMSTTKTNAELGIPEGLNLRIDEDGNKWADYRPENLRSIQAVRNADGDMVGKFEGEDVIFPDLESTLEWVLSTPVDLHLFEEAPIIKMYIEESTKQ